MLADDDVLYWLNRGRRDQLNNLSDAAIMRHDLATSETSQHLALQVLPRDMQNGGDYMFWLDSASTIHKVAKTVGAQGETVLAREQQIEKMVVTHELLVWIEVDGQDRVLYSARRDGSEILVEDSAFSGTALGANSSQAYWIDDNNLVVFDGASRQELPRISLEEGQYVFDDQIKVDDGFLYWGNVSPTEDSVLSKTSLSTGERVNLLFASNAPDDLLLDFKLLDQEVLVLTGRAGNEEHYRLETRTKEPSESIRPIAHALESTPSIDVAGDTVFWTEVGTFDDANGVVRSAGL